MGTTKIRTLTGNVLFGKTRGDVLGLLYGQTPERFYLRQIVRHVGGGVGTVQRELKKLTDAGLLVRTKIGNQVFYQANSLSPVFSEVKALVTKTVGLVEILRQALQPLSAKIKVAFVYGSMARGDERPTSDIDLMIVGNVDLAETAARLAEAQEILGREVSETVFPEAEFVSKRSAHNHFIASVLATTKLFIIGDEDELTNLGSKRLAAAPRH
jgi:predicted nucleotidyltransferase